MRSPVASPPEKPVNGGSTFACRGTTASGSELPRTFGSSRLAPRAGDARSGGTDNGDAWLVATVVTGGLIHLRIGP